MSDIGTGEGNTGEGGSTYTAPATQEDLNRIVEGRLKREREKFADYETVKDKAARFDALEQQSKTDLQKAQDLLAAKEAELKDLPAKARREAISFASASAAKGFLDPEDALAFLPSDIDLSDKDAVEAALTALAERKPHLLKQGETLKPKPKGRPKAKDGEEAEDQELEGSSGKERAAKALAQMRLR